MGRRPGELNNYGVYNTVVRLAIEVLAPFYWKSKPSSAFQRTPGAPTGAPGFASRPAEALCSVTSSGRLLLMIPTLLGVTFVVFLLVRSVPGDVTDRILGDYGAGDPEAKAALKKEFSLDQNIATQYVRWLGDVGQADFGKSLISGRTVRSELKHRLPVTFELEPAGDLLLAPDRGPVGIISAIRQDTAATTYRGASPSRCSPSPASGWASC